MGETRRFIDEIEYLLDGLTATGPKSNQTIRVSVEEIVEKCFNNKRDDYSVNVGFGMKLKSHGALEIIFEALNESDDPVVLDNLVLLITALLYDVRRLDFFFKPELAIKISKHCIYRDSDSDNLHFKMLKCTQVFNNVDIKSSKDSFLYAGIWILSKWSFSSVTTKTNNSFFDLLLKETELLKKLIKICGDEHELIEIGEKTAGLLDCLLNRKLLNDFKEREEDLIALFDEIIENQNKNLTFMKLAVSLTGSSIGKTIKNFFETVKKLINLTFPFKGELEILYLSCLINLIDRCDENFMDEFRYKTFKEDNLLKYLTREYYNCPLEFKLHKSLLALVLGFICRQNRTNIEVMSRVNEDETVFNDLKKEILNVATNFSLQQQKQQHQQEEDALVIDRLNEIILTFKK